KNGPYLSNDYWIKKLTLSSSITRELTKAFSTFSLAYDNLILKITSEWLQVLSKRKPKGLFDFSISDEDVKNFAATITTETPFNEFIDNVIFALEHLLVVK